VVVSLSQLLTGRLPAVYQLLPHGICGAIKEGLEFGLGDGVVHAVEESSEEGALGSCFEDIRTNPCAHFTQGGPDRTANL
jgi:hypothetical protein